MNKRTRRTLLVVAAVLLMLAVAIFLRSKAPPESARLLPESDGIVYLNLRPMRVFLHKQAKPPQRVPEYQQFVDATGVDWEQDLDEAAIALHRMDDPRGPNGPVAYSMVLVGKLTGQRLKNWLETHAVSRESYAGHSVYSIPSEGRTVRVAQIGYDTVAISNFPTPEKIHSILDRHATAAWPFAGSTLLTRHYHDVPLLAQAWGVGQIALPFSESGAIQVFGFKLPLVDSSTIIASVAPALQLSGALQLRVEEIAPSDEAAASQAASLTALIGLARGLSSPLGENKANNGLKALLLSAEVTPRRNRVVLTATLSRAQLASLADEENSSEIPAPNPAPPASK
jgi:hypothetical protein